MRQSSGSTTFRHVCGCGAKSGFRWRRFLGAVQVLALAAMSGCGSLAPEQRPVGLDAKAAPDAVWTAPMEGKTTTAVTGWLADFGDTSLTEVVREAIERNPDLGAVAARLRAARSRAVLAGVERFPGVLGALDGSRRERASSAAPGGASMDLRDASEQFALGLNLSWEIDLWGRLRDRARAGYADFEAAAADYEAARLSLAANAAKAWLNVAESERLVELAEKTVASFEGTQRSVESTFDRGINDVTAVELALSRSNVASARGNLATRLRERDAARRTLETLLGYYPRGAVAAGEAGGLPELKRVVPVGLPSELLVRRPDLRAVERRFAAAVQRVEESRKALLPAVRLTGATGASSTEFRELFNGELLLSSIAANLTQALFEGGRLRENVRLSLAECDALASDCTAAALEAFREVETALAAERYLAGQVAALEDASTEAEFAQERALSRFQNGLVTFITLLESQRRAFDSRSAFIRAENQRLQNRIDLYLALGGDFDTPPSTPSASAALHSASKPQ